MKNSSTSETQDHSWTVRGVRMSAAMLYHHGCDFECGFGVDAHRPTAIESDRDDSVLSLPAELKIPLVNITAGFHDALWKTSDFRSSH